VAARRYRIEVAGPLPGGLAEELPHMTVRTTDASTTLTGAMADAAALYGLISRLEGLGLVLLSLQPDP